MNEDFIGAQAAGRSKQTEIHPAVDAQGMRSMRSGQGLAALAGHTGARRCPPGAAFEAGAGTVPHNVPLLSVAVRSPGEGVCSPRLSYQRRRAGVLTIFPSADSRPWPGSKPPGETCCRTAWLVVTMEALPWWLMAPEDAASPLAAWLYRTPAKHHQSHRVTELFGLEQPSKAIQPNRQPSATMAIRPHRSNSSRDRDSPTGNLVKVPQLCQPPLKVSLQSRNPTALLGILSSCSMRMQTDKQASK